MDTYAIREGLWPDRVAQWVKTKIAFADLGSIAVPATLTNAPVLTEPFPNYAFAGDYNQANTQYVGSTMTNLNATGDSGQSAPTAPLNIALGFSKKIAGDMEVKLIDVSAYSGYIWSISIANFATSKYYQIWRRSGDIAVQGPNGVNSYHATTLKPGLKIVGTTVSLFDAETDIVISSFVTPIDVVGEDWYVQSGLRGPGQWITVEGSGAFSGSDYGLSIPVPSHSVISGVRAKTASTFQSSGGAIQPPFTTSVKLERTNEILLDPASISDTSIPNNVALSTCLVPTTHNAAGDNVLVSLVGDLSGVTEGELEVSLNLSRTI